MMSKYNILESKNMLEINGGRMKFKPTAIFDDGEIRCPRCGAKLAEAEHDAFCHAVKVYCRSKSCRMPVRIEVPKGGGTN